MCIRTLVLGVISNILFVCMGYYVITSLLWSFYPIVSLLISAMLAVTAGFISTYLSVGAWFEQGSFEGRLVFWLVFLSMTCACMAGYLYNADVAQAIAQVNELFPVAAAPVALALCSAIAIMLTAGVMAKYRATNSPY